MNVRYKHFRYMENEDGEIKLKPLAYRYKDDSVKLLRDGGATVCTIETEDGDRSIGISVCSRKDQFSRKKGTLIARGRAEKGLKVGKEIYIPETRNKVEQDVLAEVVE